MLRASVASRRGRIGPCYTAGRSPRLPATEAVTTEAPSRRMDQIFTAIGDAISSIFDNPVVKLGIQLTVIYWILLWLAVSINGSRPSPWHWPSSTPRPIGRRTTKWLG